ncbi:hypothetical protein DFH08DRAFT_943097 [Mycena albidolilacea]|uniref:Uncharacterized protein n=1 Tax=Mycena albidolilacea TaxID=1033008 RepID=A0AAD6ZB82_9AGAR|nr:hypothetical protein DFH08DRAFT_943097 [Mycena albidolilacea]
MCNHSTTTIPTFQRTAETAPTETEIKPVNHSNGPQCAHCGWRGGGHAVIPRPTLSESPHAFLILPAMIVGGRVRNSTNATITSCVGSDPMRCAAFCLIFRLHFSDCSRSVMLGTESPRFVENRCDPRHAVERQSPRLPMMAVLDGFKLHQLNGKAIIRQPRGFAAPRRLEPERRPADASEMVSVTHVIITGTPSDAPLQTAAAPFCLVQPNMQSKRPSSIVELPSSARPLRSSVTVKLLEWKNCLLGVYLCSTAQDAPLALSNARVCEVMPLPGNRDGDYLLFYARTLGLCSQAGTKLVLGSSRRSSSESGGCEGDEGDFSGVKYISLG